MDLASLQSSHCDMSRKTDKSFKILKNIGEVAYYFPRHEPLLCVGCGDGFELDTWKLLGYKDVKGIDIDPEKIAIAKSFGCNAEVCSIEDYWEEDEIDRNIYCAHTLEHCVNADEIMRKLCSMTLSTLCVIFPIEKKGTKNPSHISPIKSLADIDYDYLKPVRLYENHNYELQGIIVCRRL